MLAYTRELLIDKLAELSELQIYKNIDVVKTATIKKQREKIKQLENPALARIEEMIANGTLEKWIDQNCRMVNGKINWSAMKRELNKSRKYLQSIFERKKLNYLIDETKNTYLE